MLALSHHRATRTTQVALLLFMASYLVFLFLAVTFRSEERSSIFDFSSPGASSATNEGSAVVTASRFQLKDFHRVEMKDGKPAWEVRAKDANYFNSEQLVQMREATVTVYRENAEPVHFRGDAASLFLAGDKLRNASFEGNIVANVDSDTVIRTSRANYDAEADRLHAPGRATIEGTAYQIKGIGLSVVLNKKLLNLEEQVWSRFEPGATMPTLVGEVQ